MKYSKALCIFLVLWTPSLYAALSLTVTLAHHHALPIGLSITNAPLKNLVSEDLDRSGWVKVVQEGHMLYTFKDNCLYKNSKKISCISGHNLSQENLAHIIADNIFHDITGKKSWFSSKIALVSADMKSYKKRNYRLEVTDSVGKNSHTIFSARQPIMSPAWSPDQKNLAYVSFESGKASIWMQNLSNGQRIKLSDAPGINGAPAWSPDQKSMAIVLSQHGHPKIYLLNISSRQLSPLTDGSSMDTEPLWHPDGKSLLYTSSRGGASPQIYRMDLSTRRSERITFFGDYNATPSISKDGKRLATLSRKNGRFMVVVHDLNTQKTSVISALGSEEQPKIHEGGEIVLFGIRQGGRMQIAMQQIDLDARYTLPSDQGWARFATWSPTPQHTYHNTHLE